MRLVLTALIFGAGLLFFLIGFNFLLMPAEAGAGFGLSPNGTAGLAVLRADFPAFFIVGAACMIWGAWKRNGDLLLVSPPRCSASRCSDAASASRSTGPSRASCSRWRSKPRRWCLR